MVLKRVEKSYLDNLTYIFNRFIGYGFFGNYWSMLAGCIWDAIRISNKKRYATCLSHIYLFNEFSEYKEFSDHFHATLNSLNSLFSLFSLCLLDWCGGGVLVITP